MTKRRQDWPIRLFDFLAQRRYQPFEWGSNDCCLFVCDAVLAMTDRDPGADLRVYSTEHGALRLIAERGGLETLVADRCEEIGFAELTSVRAAQRGDVALFDNEGRPAIGICIGDRVAFAGKDGVVHHPIDRCRRAWRVG